MLYRRDLLKGTLGGSALLALSNLGCASEDESSEAKVFLNGIASFDPVSDGVLLWARVTTSEASSEVTWQIAKDPAFSTIAFEGTAIADAANDHTVVVDAKGLEAGTFYFYRFVALGETSKIGRTKTAPASGDRLRFAVVSCSNFAYGYFHVYREIAERADFDAVIHLGDYIYEYGNKEYGEVRECDPPTEILSLSDYRRRYAQYRSDPDLIEAHRQHPFICTWDDHEFANDAYRDGAENHQVEEGDWAARRAIAAKVNAEWLPARGVPVGQIHRRVRYGDLADLAILDTRIWGRQQRATGASDPTLLDENRQLLGADQEAWLFELLKTSPCRWKVICQQVMMSPLPQFLNTDQWDGYPQARDRLFDVLEKTPVSNAIVLTGDIHSSWACDLARDPKDPAIYEPATGKGAFAVEFLGPAVSSPGFPRQLASVAQGLQADNPWMKFVDVARRGFMVLDLDAARAQCAYFHVPDVEPKERQFATFSAALSTLSGENHLRIDASAAEPRTVAALAP